MSGFFSMDEKQAGGFDALPKGEYEVVISEVKVDKSSNGNPMIKATLTVRTDVDQEGSNRKIFDNLVATEKAMFKFHNLGKALGWEQGREFATLDEYAREILYKPVRIKLGQRTYQDKLQNNVESYIPAQAPYGGPSNSDDPFAVPAGSKGGDSDLPF